MFLPPIADLVSLLVEVGAVKPNDHRINVLRKSKNEGPRNGIRNGTQLTEDDDDWD